MDACRNEIENSRGIPLRRSSYQQNVVVLDAAAEAEEAVQGDEGAEADGETTRLQRQSTPQAPLLPRKK